MPTVGFAGFVETRAEVIDNETCGRAAQVGNEAGPIELPWPNKRCNCRKTMYIGPLAVDCSRFVRRFSRGRGPALAKVQAEERVMPNRRKPFVVYRRWQGRFTIVPRGVAGWGQFAVWMALLVALVVWFARHLETNAKAPGYYEGIGLFGAGLLAWVVGGLWWMFAHAEVIDMSEFMRDRQREARRRRRKER